MIFATAKRIEYIPPRFQAFVSVVKPSAKTVRYKRIGQEGNAFPFGIIGLLPRIRETGFGERESRSIIGCFCLTILIRLFIGLFIGKNLCFIYSFQPRVKILIIRVNFWIKIFLVS